jgi:oxygen-independent coproporphyrinogen-3 oxidase
MRGLYLHIPFCAKRCHYCDFVITTDRSLKTRTRFLKALETQIDWAKERWGHLRFDTVYLGGGTPSSLDISELKRIFQLIHLSFDLAPNPEITCELNPEDANPKKLAALKGMGVNRLSIGIQSLNDRLLKAMGRIHDADQAQIALKQAMAIGFPNISADLILRLPGQTPEDLVSSVKILIALGASQVVLYDLDVHNHTVFGWQKRQGQLTLPSDETHLEMFQQAAAMLEAHGYRAYELTSFAKPGFECRHNLIYWRNGEYLGLGPGAFSFLDGIRFQFARYLHRYISKCLDGDWEPDEQVVVGLKERQLETLMVGLRLAEGVPLRDLADLHPILEGAILRPWIEEGWVEYERQTIRLTRKGWPVAERIIQELVIDCLAQMGLPSCHHDRLHVQ